MKKRVFSKIKSLFSNHLLAVNVASSGGLLVFGDFIQQHIEIWNKSHSTGSFDKERSGRLLLMGLFHGAPRHYFYVYLEKYLPGRDAYSVMRKILLDELVLSVFIDFSFVYGVTALEGYGHARSLDVTLDKFPTIYMWDWLLWPPLQILNFYFLPLRYRVIFVSTLNLVWNTLLSYFKHN